MSLMRLLVCSLACIAPAAHADVFAHPKSAEDLAQNLLAQPAKEISQARVLRGKFIHKKYLAEMPAPLEARGEFVFMRDRGLYWHTLQPFESVFVLTPTAIVQQDEGGAAMKMDAARQPAVRAAAGIFMALFSVDLQSLAKQFDLYGSVDETAEKSAQKSGAWQLGLRPKDSAMSAVFKRAVVNGAARVQAVELQDAHGDRTLIQLLDTELSNREPTAQERALLAP